MANARDRDEVLPASPPEPSALPEDRMETHDLGLPSSDETRELIERAKAGEAEALNTLFSKYQGQMLELARRKIGPRLRTKEDADDLAQTTFREATRDIGRYEYRGGDSFLRWLVRILQNKIRDKAEYYGATKRDVTREHSGDATAGSGDVLRFDPPSRDPTITQTLVREEEFRILRDALAELTPDHRKAITLVFFEGLSLGQAGAVMDRSEDAVRMLLRRAEARLQELTRARLAR